MNFDEGGGYCDDLIGEYDAGDLMSAIYF